MRLFLLLLSFVSLASCSEPVSSRQPTQDSLPGAAPVRIVVAPVADTAFWDTVHHYTIAYPKTWSRQLIQNAITFRSPLEDSTDPFQENVSLSLQEMGPTPITLDQFVGFSIQQNEKDTLSKAKVTSVEDALVNGVPAKVLRTNLEYGQARLRLKQVCLIHGPYVYVLTYTATPEAFLRYEPTAMRIMNSLRFDK